MPKKKESIGNSYDAVRKKDRINSLIKPTLWEKDSRKKCKCFYLFGWMLWFEKGWWKLFYSVSWGHFRNILIIQGENNLERAKKMSYEHIIRQKQIEIIQIHKDIMKIVMEG